METQLLTTAEAARRLRLAPVTLETWRRGGKGPPFIRLSSNAIRYRPEDLDSWVAERTEQPESDD